MNKIIGALSFTLLCISCEQIQSHKLNKNSLIVQQDTISKNNLRLKSTQTWVDSSIIHYITTSDNELIKSSFKNKVSEEWLFDQTINTDTAKYLIFKIGHDESDEGGKNLRFITDQWAYIDSATRTLFEYDIVNDSLIRWTK